MEHTQWTRAELVAFVQEVLAETGRIRDNNSRGIVRIYRDNARSLELVFHTPNMEQLPYTMPLPPAVLALLANKTQNPYDDVRLEVRVTAAAPISAPLEKPEPPASEPKPP